MYNTINYLHYILGWFSRHVQQKDNYSKTNNVGRYVGQMGGSDVMDHNSSYSTSSNWISGYFDENISIGHSNKFL